MKTSVQYFRKAGWKVALGTLCMAALAAAQTPSAPERPTCTAVTGPGSCKFKDTTGVGPGSRVILSDRTGGHDQSKAYLRDALARLSRQYGFTVTRINDVNDITDAYLQTAKVIIFSNGDGDLGQSIPNASVRARVENFVKQNGWGMIMIHAACAFISSWPFQQQACIQQYNHHNGSGTPATMYVENRNAGGSPQGRMNPYSSFFLAGLPDSVRMSDEWYTWSSSPLTTNQVAGAQITNKIMLMRINEDSYPSDDRPVAPTYGIDHYLMWTHTQGKGITIFQSFGHDDTYQEDGTRRAYGDSLLWREIRYAAKDWQAASTVSVVASDIRTHFNLTRNTGSISLSFGDATTPVSVKVADVSGRQVYSRTFSGQRSAEITGLKRGVYFVKFTSNRNQETRKVCLY